MTTVTMVGSQGEFVSTLRAPMNARVLQATSTAALSINACVSKGEHVPVLGQYGDLLKAVKHLHTYESELVL